MNALLALAGLMLAVAACGNGSAKTTTEHVLSPIDAAEIRTAESFPPQYFLDVTSGLPSGCAKFDRYDLDRSEDGITVSVWNIVETPEDGACTAVYGQVEHHIALGSNFQSGNTYTVHVNDVTRTFVAQ
jgi:hypothetical protein